jgi:hypothetical protein
MIKNLMNNMMIQDLNNMVDLMKMLILWKSYQYEKGPERCCKSSNCKYLHLFFLKSTEAIAIKEENTTGA